MKTDRGILLMRYHIRSVPTLGQPEMIAGRVCRMSGSDGKTPDDCRTYVPDVGRQRKNRHIQHEKRSYIVWLRFSHIGER